MIKYPIELPLPLQSGYKLSTENPKMETQLESGRFRERRKFTFVPTTIRATWNMDEAQMAFFEAWFARTLVDGTLWFEAKLKTPAGFKDYICKIKGMYDGPELVQVSRYEISATLLLRDRPLIDPGWENFPDFWFNKNIIDIALNEKWPAFVEPFGPLLTEGGESIITESGEEILV